MNKVILCLILFFAILSADEVYNLNKRANKLYSQQKYAEALELYNKALEINPTDPNLLTNKGSALFKLGDPEKASETYKAAAGSDTSNSRSDIYYNLGNALDMYGDMLAQKGDQSAMEKYKEAKQNYIKSLDANSRDNDTKWNLQIINEKIKQMEQQQQNQDNKDQKNDDQNKDQQNQDQQNKDKNDQNKDNKENKDQNQQDKEDKQNQEKEDQQKEEDKKDQEDKEQEQQSQNEQDKQDEQQPPKPQPSEPQESEEEKMEKEEALRLLLQYADDDELNKPTKKMKARPKGSPEKDW